MDQLQKYISQVRVQLLIILCLNNLLIFANWWLGSEVFRLTGYWLFAAIMIVPLLTVTIVPWLSAAYLTQPVKLIWQAVLHIAPESHGVAAPDLKSAKLGRELITNLIAHVYQLADVAEHVEKLANSTPEDLRSNFIANNLPLPLIVLQGDGTILFANDTFLKYTSRDHDEVIGNNVYSVLDMSFPSEDTLEAWLTKAKTSAATASKTWERVRMGQAEKLLQFDLAAYYNRDNPSGVETILAFFDHTQTYAQDDQNLSFVALAVHELRTPLTLLRGYIEVFSEELDSSLNTELMDFMYKMNAAAQQLTMFVGNILNVARVEGDQLFLRLHCADWAEIIHMAERDWSARARLHGINLECTVAPDLPAVGVDQVSMYEVLSNLIDNAIKYSGPNGKRIIINAEVTENGLVETTVQDFGVGIPESAVPQLFEKFYRNNHTRAQVGGTGLGLYLSKAIVSAHGGNIWVRSRPGEGATFGFSVLPYEQLTREQKDRGSQDITVSAHGWIKNHSMYRR